MLIRFGAIIAVSTVAIVGCAVKPAQYSNQSDKSQPLEIVDVDLSCPDVDTPPREITATVKSVGTGTVTISARWMYEKTQPVNQTNQSLYANGPAITTFRIANPKVWPLGRYRVGILLNGREVQVRKFSITMSGPSTLTQRPECTFAH
jgi:hypothetical protein